MALRDLQDVKNLPELEAVRLLKAAQEILRSSTRSGMPAVVVALAAVDAVFAAEHQTSATNARKISERLRMGARGLGTISDDKLQRAMLAMMAAADMRDR